MRKNGFGMIEVVLGISIIFLAFFGVIAVAQFSVRVSGESTNNVKAVFLMEEGMEALKNLRDRGWSNISSLTADTNYFFNFTGSAWATSAANVFVDGFYERKFKLENVYRNANQDIATSGTLDPNTKKATVYVSWRTQSGTTTRSVSAYLLNLF
jgi:Tfp pilus assembly protein PilV